MIVEKGKLKNALNKISVFVDRDANGVGSKILFSAKDGIASLTAGDGSNVGVFRFEVADKSEMAFAAEYKSFSAAANLRGDINIGYENSLMTITQGITEIVFPASDGNSFSFSEQKIEDGGAIKINSTILKKLVGKVSYARKEKDSRPFVTGVNLSFDGEKLKVESTDALRMLRNYTTIQNAQGITFKGVLSPKCIKAIESLDEDKEITLTMNESAIGLQADDMRVYLPQLNCKYPDASRFFELEEKATFILDKDKAIESTDLLAGATDNKALLCKKVGTQLLFSLEDGISKAKDEIAIDSSTGADFEFCLDIENFRDIFRNLRDSNKVTFVWNDPFSQLMFHDEENLDGVVMPLRK